MAALYTDIHNLVLNVGIEFVNIDQILVKRLTRDLLCRVIYNSYCNTR